MAKIDYKARMRELRGFVDFNYDLRKNLSPASKGKINKYWEELQEAKAQPHRIYRAKSKKQLNAVKSATGFQLPGFKVAIIPNPDPQNPYKVKAIKSGLVFSNSTSDKYFIPFKMDNLATDTQGEIKRALKKAKGDLIAIACGKFEYRQRFDNKQKAEKTLNMFVAKYDVEGHHHYSKWLLGIYDVKIKNQERLTDEMAKKALYKINRKKRRTGKNGNKKNRNR